MIEDTIVTADKTVAYIRWRCRQLLRLRRHRHHNRDFVRHSYQRG